MQPKGYSGITWRNILENAQMFDTITQVPRLVQEERRRLVKLNGYQGLFRNKISEGVM